MSQVHTFVAKLLEACPFVREHADEDSLDLPTVVFGDAARLLREGAISEQQQDALFAFFNSFAEDFDGECLEILGTGAIETLNDDARTQRLAKAKLTGKARKMLDEYRQYWGQPDYG